jgi:hypothetical protein
MNYKELKLSLLFYQSCPKQHELYFKIFRYIFGNYSFIIFQVWISHFIAQYFNTFKVTIKCGNMQWRSPSFVL